MTSKIKIWASLLVPFLLDRFSKYMAMNFLEFDKEYNITSFFSLRRVFNKGVSWGLLSFSATGEGAAKIEYIAFIFIVITVLFFLGWFIFHAYKAHQRNEFILHYCVLISGGMSNLYDRFLYGAVIDFITFHTKMYYFPIFNIADVCIVSAIFYFFYTQLISQKDILKNQE